MPESLLELLNNPGSPILYDVVISDSEDEPVMVEADPGLRPRITEFILGQSFYDIGHFHDMLKELRF